MPAGEEKVEKLEDLVVDEKEQAKEFLTTTLLDFLRITEMGNTVTHQKMEELPSKKQVTVVLLALKAMDHLTIREEEKAGSTEINEVSGIPLGTVKPMVRALEKERLTEKENGKYYIPEHNLEKAKKFIVGGEDG